MFSNLSSLFDLPNHNVYGGGGWSLGFFLIFLICLLNNISDNVHTKINLISPYRDFAHNWVEFTMYPQSLFKLLKGQQNSIMFGQEITLRKTSKKMLKSFYYI